MRWYQTLSGRLLVGSLLLLVILFGIYSYFSVHFYTGQMMSQVLESANRVSDFIKSSTHYSMLQNRKEDVYQIIRTIGSQAGIEGIRIYNKRGEITFSTDQSERRTVVDLKAEACYGCHDQARPLESVPVGTRTRIYTGPDGRRILGLINPIRNESACSSAGCHSHPEERTVLGVLDVRMSLDRVDATIAKAQWQIVVVAVALVLLVAIGSVAFLSFTVLRPVKKLMEGTQAISSGNLEYQIKMSAKDEIGLLASSFNRMTQSLQRAEKENREWAATLEHRVREKTEELKEIHQHILQIEKMASLGRLSATVAHELNNPLEGILTYAKLIGRRLRKLVGRPDEVEQTLADIELVQRETERCGTIVKNLLLFSKKQVGEFVLVPVKQIVEKAQQLVQHHLEISNVQFEAEFPEREVMLLCDENQIEQALVALFVNAVEAMPDGGRLRVGVTQAGADSNIEILVEDTGVGIPAEDVEHVFEPFYTTKKNGQGVGLGLSVVYGIVERHGGTIMVTSQVGKGTRFTLRFSRPTSSTEQREPRSAGDSREDSSERQHTTSRGTV
jgi:two-component system NtrC family sensor kinase